MDDAETLRAVREQYENFPYPPTNPDDEKRRLYMPITEGFDRMLHYCYGGKRDFRKNFRALVAGGGTGDAAIALAEQCRGGETEIVYVDLSRASMAIAKERARLRGLTNITWIHDSIYNIPQLQLGQFDYINSSGVLHHLSDPPRGLQILTDALKEDGAMALMVYAKYGRMAVYQMQEALRYLNRDEPNLQKQVDRAGILLRSLPVTNWFRHSPQMILAEALASDIGRYDLLLHPQDRAYSIPELYDFLENANLHLLQLFPDDNAIGPHQYNPAYYLKDAELEQRALALPPRDQQALAELLNGHIIKHTFYAAKKPVTPPSPTDLEMVPFLGFNIFSEQNVIADIIARSQTTVLIQQQHSKTTLIMVKSPNMEALFRGIDGKSTLREIFGKIMHSPSGKKNKVNYQMLTEEFTAIFQMFNAHYWMFLRHKDTQPVLYLDTLQSRMPKQA